MTIGITINETSWAIKEEVTEGTYVEETGGTDFIEVLPEQEHVPSKDLISRETLSPDVEPTAPRVGQKSVTETIPVEFKAAPNARVGDSSEANVLYKNLLGGRRQKTTQTTTKVAGNTSTELQIEDADIGDFAVGDIVKVLEAGAFEIRPISAVDTSGGSASITFPFALDNGAPSASVVIEEFTTFFPDSTNAKTISATRYIGGTIREKGIGMRVASATLGNFATNQVANMSFALEGLDFDREDGAPLFTPSFDGNEPPVILESCIFLNGVQVDANEFTLVMENTIGFLTSTCSANGKISSRITDLAVNGTLNPYMDDTDVAARFERFRDNDDNTLFVIVSEPSGTTGEDKEFVGIWIPKLKLVEDPMGDQEGIATDALSFQAFRELGNDTVFIGFI